MQEENAVCVFGCPDFPKLMADLRGALWDFGHLVNDLPNDTFILKNRYFTARVRFFEHNERDLSDMDVDGLVVFARPEKYPKKEHLGGYAFLSALVRDKELEYQLDDDGVLLEYCLTVDELAELVAMAPFTKFSREDEGADPATAEAGDVTLDALLADVRDEAVRDEIRQLAAAIRAMTVMNPSVEAEVDTFAVVFKLMGDMKATLAAADDETRRAGALAMAYVIGDAFGDLEDEAPGEELN